MKLLIIDRDGVLARDPSGRTARTQGWQVMPGSAEAISRLVHSGWRVAMMADSGPLTRGATDMAGLNEMHGHLLDEIEAAGGQVDAVIFVPPAGAHARLEHAAVSLVDALARLGASPADTVLVADTCDDLEAGHVAGCRPVLVLSGHGCTEFGAEQLPPGTVVRPDLSALAAELAP